MGHVVRRPHFGGEPAARCNVDACGAGPGAYQPSSMLPEVEDSRDCQGTKKSSRRLWEVDDGLWERIEPRSPQVKSNPRHPGRPRLDGRKVLNGILFALYTGIRWEFLPQELGYGSG
jgi:hypothetical protein